METLTKVVADVTGLGETTGSKSTVAIFGASGHLGKYIAQAFLTSSMRPNFHNVILFTRQTAKIPPEFQRWQETGQATIRQIGNDSSQLAQGLSDVDIVVNVIGSAGDELRKQVVHAMAESKVKLYFPSEFGVDHTVHDFGHPEWDKKKKHYTLAKDTLPNTKICRVYAGLFLEDSIGPWFGFDTKNGRYESYGSSREKVSYTSLADVGRAVATLALMPPSQLPNQVHLSGDLVSAADIASIMRSQSKSEITCIEQPLDASKTKELDLARPDPSGCLRFLMGEGKIKHTSEAMGCENELVNPAQSKWTWKTMIDHAAETNGRPWADMSWS